MGDLLFGIDIAQEVADAFDSAGGLNAGVLEKVTRGARDPANPTAARDRTPTNHNFQGFIEHRTVLEADTAVARSIPQMTIIGKSVRPLVVPEVGDKATISSLTFNLVRLIRNDPADATYVFEVR